MNEYDKVYQNVASSLQRDIDELISGYEDGLAMKMMSEVRGYNPDYASEDAQTPEYKKYAKFRENAVLDLVEAMLTILFANEQ